MSSDGAELSVPRRLQQNLASCVRSIWSGDPSQSQGSVLELVAFLDSVSMTALSKPGNDKAKTDVLVILSEIYDFLCSPALDQEVLDALSFELPKAVSKFAPISSECLEIADRIVGQFNERCSPRDMLAVVYEGLDSLRKASEPAACFHPLLTSFVKVYPSIKRRQSEQLKAAAPVVIKVLEAVLSESNNDNVEVESLFIKAIDIASCIHLVTTRLEGEANEKLLALLGSYILQIMALVSISQRSRVSCQKVLASRFAGFLPLCGLSYVGLITGTDVNTITYIVLDGKGVYEEEDYMSCSPFIKLGAALSVIWGLISDKVAQACREDIGAVKHELQTNQTKRWQALGMLKHVLSWVDLPWEFKGHAIELLLSITSANSDNKLDEHTDFSSHMTSFFCVLEALITVIIYASNAKLRKSAFEAFKKVLADIPITERFDMLKALISKSESSTMIAILLDVVREQMRNEPCQRTSMEKNKTPDNCENTCQHTSFWNPGVLDLVENILRPPQGGAPPLPENGDAVLSALNFYRFILMAESAGKTNYTGVLRKSALKKAYSEWFLPLRALVADTIMKNRDEPEQLANEVLCALSPLEMVLHRCVELTEEKLESAAA